MGEKAAVGVARPITSRRGTGGALGLKGLPGKGGAVQHALLLALGSQWASVSAAVGGVLPADVAHAVAAWHRASEKDFTV